MWSSHFRYLLIHCPQSSISGRRGYHGKTKHWANDIHWCQAFAPSQTRAVQWIKFSRPEPWRSLGVYENPDITIETPFEVWMDIMTRKVDGQQMFMEQKYTVDGDLALLIELFQKQTDWKQICNTNGSCKGLGKNIIHILTCLFARVRRCISGHN